MMPGGWGLNVVGMCVVCEGRWILPPPHPFSCPPVLLQTYFSHYKGYYFTGDGARRDEDG